jgi:hypothetical protein
MTANEGEPNDTYSIDPDGSVSIAVNANYAVTTLSFESFSNQLSTLKTKASELQVQLIILL